MGFISVALGLYGCVLTYGFTCSFAYLFAIFIALTFDSINMTGRLGGKKKKKVQQYSWPYLGKIYCSVSETGLLCHRYHPVDPFKWLVNLIAFLSVLFKLLCSGGSGDRLY